MLKTHVEVPDSDFKAGLGPSWSPGVTKVISVDGSGAKIPGSERKAPQPPKPEPHVEGEKDVEESKQSKPKGNGKDTAPVVRSEGEGTEEEPKETPAVDGEPEEPKPNQDPPHGEPPVTKEDVKTEEPENRTQEFLKLTRKERKVLEREKQLRAKEANVDKLLAALDSKDEEKVLEYLAEKGITYDGITKKLLSKKELEPVDRVEQKVDKIEKRLSEEEEKKEEAEYVETRKTVTGNVRTLVNAHKDKYEYLSAMGAEADELVYEILEVYAERTGKMLTYQEGLDLGEKHYETLAKRLSGSQKLRKLVQPPKTDGEGEGQTATATQRPTKTLTNAQSTAAPHQQERPLTPEERKRKAASMLRWIEVE